MARTLGHLQFELLLCGLDSKVRLRLKCFINGLVFSLHLAWNKPLVTAQKRSCRPLGWSSWWPALTCGAMVRTVLLWMILLDRKFIVGWLDSLMLSDAMGLMMATSAFGVASSAEAKTDFLDFTFDAFFAQDFRTIDYELGVICAWFASQVLYQILWRHWCPHHISRRIRLILYWFLFYILLQLCLNRVLWYLINQANGLCWVSLLEIIRLASDLKDTTWQVVLI